MKRLAELFGVIPGYAAQLEEAGVRTILDLARVTDLKTLSSQSNVPAEMVGEWQQRAVLELATATRRQRVTTIFVVIMAGFLFAVAAWSFTGPGSTPRGVRVSWNPPSPKPGITVATYYVYRTSQSGDGTYQKVASVAGGTSYEDSGVEAGHTYHYFIKAVDSEGNESPPSSQITAAVP